MGISIEEARGVREPNSTPPMDRDQAPTYETQLLPSEEAKFQTWKSRYAPRDSGADYDLRGAYQAGLKPDAASGHWPDTFKKPNHPTFSVESKYAKDRPDLAGSWNVEEYIPAGKGKKTISMEEARGQPKPSLGERATAIGKQAVGDLAAVGDFVVDSFFMPLSVGANLFSAAIGLASGQDRREALQKGREIGAKFTPSIFQKLLSMSPTFQKAYEDSVATGSLDKLNKVIEQIGVNVESKTGGKILQEDVQNMFDVGMLGMMGKGAARASAPKPLYEQPKIRVTDPKQLFPDDEAHSRFEADFAPKTGTDLVVRRPKGKAGGELVEPGTPDWYASDVAKAAALGAGAVGLSQLDQDEAGAALAVAGGIKAKGGMWHPEAIKRLAEPLTKSLQSPQIARLREIRQERNADLQTARDTYASEVKPLANWTQDRVSKYLNRYAGTADDPLKDVKLPSGKSWEEVTDKLITGYPARFHVEGNADKNLSGVPLDKPVYDVRRHGPEQPRAEYEELSGYLSHVGDYLRQNVELSKLPQYDLVRAVKETAKNDERVAKEMEKARGESTAQLPVHKDYGNGMKWVELKLPEKLTEEQAKGVRKAEIGELSREKSPRGWGQGSEAVAGYVAIDSKGKPIRNSYTEENAGGKTPEEAWLAGRLAEEGNTMGHCFPPGTLVNALVPTSIEKLVVGSEVITHTGELRRVTEQFVRNYQGDLIEVTTRGGSPFECTPEHPLLVLRPVSTGSLWQDRYVEKRLPDTLVPEWRKVDELRIGDYLLSPGLQRPVVPSTHSDLAWLCGVYAGDGDAAGGSGVGLTLSKQDDVERVVTTFAQMGYDTRVKDAGNFYRVRVNSVKLSAQFRDWFGGTSHEKHLPAFLFGPDSDLQATLDGLMMADGTYYQGRCRLMSTSFVLMQQAWLIAVTLGYRPSIKPYRRVSGYANAAPAWTVEWQEAEGKWHANRRWNAFYITQVTELAKRPYKGPVFNIEVEEDHSYLVNGLAVHNCVGGYCEGVASGESKIYSLRDKKGESHVTVEVRPDTVDPAYRDKMGQVKGDDILQIKGKQNRAPDSRYLPYVQDFVKGGKWGEVGDLEGTGLIRGDSAQGAEVLGMKLSAKDLRLDPSKYYTPREVTDTARRLLPFDDLAGAIQREHPGVGVVLGESPSGAIALASIALKKDAARGKGLAQAAIRDTTAWADANNRGMMLLAVPDEGGPSLAKLVEIYKRHDFKEADYQPFPDLGRRMYRNPKGAPDVDLFAGAEEGPGAMEGSEPAGAGGGAGEGGPRVVPAERPAGPGRGQEGSVDQRLLAGLAGAGVGLALAGQLADDPSIRQYLLSALVGGVLPYVAKVARTLGDVADPVAGMLSTRIKNISEPIHLRALDFEREVLRDTTKYITAGAGFLRSLAKYDNPELNRAIVSNDQAAIKAALLKSNNPDLIQGWMHARAALNEIGGKLKDIDRIPTVLDGYFPRVVKDVEGLLNYLGHEAKTELQTKLADAERAKAAEGGLSDIERSKIINQFLSGRMREGKPGFAKGRTIREVTDDLMQFYMEPGEAYTHYVNASVNDLAKAKFFGRDVVKSKGAVDVDSSIGNVVDRELKAGRIDFEDADQLRNLLGARFGPEARMLPEGATRFIQRVQNLSYAGLLGNLVAAATQIADTGMAVYATGLTTSIAAVARKLTGNMQIKAADLGVVNHISDEFTTQGKSAKFLNQVMKYSGFTLIDRAGKDILVQGAYSKFKRMADSPSGRAELGRQYSEAFGDEFLPLLDDLRSGDVTDRVQSLLFAELSRYQPISRLEAPEMHNRIPDIRPAYMLKRWMLKQADVVRRDGYNEIKKGNLVKGATNMTRFALALGISGATTQLIKDWLENKPMGEDWFPVMDNVLKTFNWSEYTADLAKREGPGAVAVNMIAPPYRMWDTILRGDPRALQHVPVVGRMLYGHFFQEEIEKKEAAKQKRKEREANK